MSTRSLNIIKQDNKLFIFWVHWNGETIADVVLNWNSHELEYAKKKIATGCQVGVVDHIYTRQDIIRHIKKCAAELIADVTTDDLQCRLDNDFRVQYAQSNFSNYDYVTIYKYTGLSCFEYDATTFGEFNSVNDVLKRINELTGRHFIADIQIGNYIDFDEKVCRFEYDFDNWSRKKQKRVEHTVTFAKAFPFDRVKKYGAMYSMGKRYYSND